MKNHEPKLNPPRLNNLIFIGGDKGGVGKSMLTLAVIDTFLNAQKSVVLIETDDTNPDTYKCLHTLITCEICNLDHADGYLRLGHVMETHKNVTIVVNTAARVFKKIINEWRLIQETASELGRDIVILWPINRQRDSLESLKLFIDQTQKESYQALYVALNLYFGTEEKFSRYHHSKLKDLVSKTLIFPELNDVVSDKLNDARLALSQAENVGTLTLMERSYLHRYRDSIHHEFKLLVA